MQAPVQSVSGGLELSGRTADHSTSSSVEVQNGGAIPQQPYTHECGAVVE